MKTLAAILTPAGRGAALCAASLLVLCQASAAGAQSRAKITQVTKPQITAIEASKAKRTPPEEKISSQLLDIAAERNTGVVNAAAPHLKSSAPRAVQDIQVDIQATAISQDLLDAITTAKGRIDHLSERHNSLRATLPTTAFVPLAKRSDVKSMRKAEEPRTNAQHPPVSPEGVFAHAANRAREQFNVSGKGVVVCVLSDSIDNADGAKAKAIADGDFDGQALNVLPGEDGDGAGEGLAMLEIIHSVAPDAELWFATGNGGEARMADNILELADKAHCNVIVDDLTYPSESPFQDDDISRAVDEVSDNGVLYFSSARNSGSKKHGTASTWEGMFQDGGPAGPMFKGVGAGARIHVFENGKTLDTADMAGPDDRVDLFWSDPLGGSGNGYDLFVVDKYGQVVGASTTSHTGAQDPYQSVPRLHQGQSIVIIKEAKAQPRYLHLEAGQAVLRYSTEGSVRGHNASGADNAFTVAARAAPGNNAVFSGGPGATVEPFSSDGPRRVFYDPTGRPITPGNYSANGGMVRQKPDITAADAVSTSLPLNSPLNPFKGTSAAAPHAAAIAALMLSCTPRPTPAQVRAAFRTSAIAIEGDSGNINAGYGVVMAHAAVKAVCPPAQAASQAVAVSALPSP